MKKYLRPNEYCEIYRISKPTVYRHIKNGLIEHIRIGSNILIPNKEETEQEDPIEKSESPISFPPKSVLESSLERISPHITESLSNPPDFGSITIEITYHEGRPTKIECGKSIKKRVI